MKTFNAALVGCGGIYPLHADAIKNIEHVELKAFCDIKPQRADEAAKRYGGVAVYDYEEILKRDDIDVIHICTPHYLHAPMAIEAIKAGKYVLCEKPIATNLNDAKAMIQTSKAWGGRLGIILQNRYNDASVKLKQIIEEKQYGELESLRGAVTWHREESYYHDNWHGKADLEGGGVLINQAIHTLDLVQWLQGSVPCSVSASISNDSLKGVIEVEDTAHLFIKFKNGSSTVFYATNAHRINSSVEIEAVTKDAIFYLRGTSLYIEQDGRLELMVNGTLHEGEKEYWGDSHVRQVEDFYKSLAENKPIIIDGVQAYHVLSIIMAAYKSSNTGEEVVVEAL